MYTAMLSVYIGPRMNLEDVVVCARRRSRVGLRDVTEERL